MPAAPLQLKGAPEAGTTSPVPDSSSSFPKPAASAEAWLVGRTCTSLCGTPWWGERWMLSIPRKRKQYPLPAGKEQVLALAAEEKLFIHSAGVHTGNPSPSPYRACPAVLAAGQVPKGVWVCKCPRLAGKLVLTVSLLGKKALPLVTKGRRKRRTAEWLA